MTRIEELESLISKAQEAYYNLDPIISDQEYDALYDELKRLKPASDAIVKVGTLPPTTSPWVKMAHEIQMGSLSKVNSIEEYNAWVRKTGEVEYIICDKYDGISLECIYENGRLKNAITRGDGIIGEDVTRNAMHIPNIPKILAMSSKISVRGEVIITKKDFSIHFANKYANARNTVAGKIRDTKDGTNAAGYFKFMSFDMIGIENRSFSQMFHCLKSMGFDSPEFQYVGRHEEIHEYYLKRKADRENLNHEIDGCVISVNDLKSFEGLGSENARPLGSIAYKFDHAMGVSKVVDIKWYTGSSGRVSPVAIIEPINIQGVVITRVSLQNKEAMRNLKLFKGARVLVSRRNDVIPYLQENLDINSQDES